MAVGVHTTVEGPAGHPLTRRLALAGAVGPVVAVVSYTVAGLLRPGYSAVHQAISALGTGPNGWLVDGAGVLLGLAVIAFAVGFAVLMRPALGARARGFAVGCFIADGLGVLTASAFTSAPSTVALHTLGAVLGTVVSLVAFVVVGVGLRRRPQWRRWGSYSLSAAVVAVGLVVMEYAFLMPRSPLHTLHLGGLLERADFVWHYGWYVAFGARLYLGTTATRGSARRVGPHEADSADD